MAPTIVKNPFESTFETMTGQAKATAKVVQQTVSDTAKTAVTDVKQQLGMDVGGGQQEPSLLEQSGVKQLPKQQQQTLQQQQQQVLEQTRQNLQKINQEIDQVRQTKIKREQEVKKAEQQKKQQKKEEEKKKKEEDPVWKQMLKGKMGSKESMKNVAG